MPDANEGRQEPFWNRRIELPPAVNRIGKALLVCLGALFGLLFLLQFAFGIWHALNFGPGARLWLSDSAFVRVPDRFSAVEVSADRERMRVFVIRHSGQERGGFISVSSLQPNVDDLGFHDPARMAAEARAKNEEVKGPVAFSYAGFDVTATVDPTTGRARDEGRHTLHALIDMDGRLVYVRADSASLGVSDNADPRTMATAAMELLRLGAR